MLKGRRILIVEDDYFLAEDMMLLFTEAGATVAGPVATLAEALAAVEGEAQLDGAVLDINLRGELSFPVADALISRGVPFVFATGYDCSLLPERFANVPACEKPVAPDWLTATLFGSGKDAADVTGAGTSASSGT
ncbi:response regulator [Aurantimonas sp. VKM B-3413]|uniref:response regulator n=1 Tax=Aurantimonas sp. VKM B-3413 TaxID=2779401 RepID=UPI001E36BEE9|nr:response regulator [Aurantimonas sp. VKM B-3413]MCB8837054.1 response regulator [Aurantimonas sp. VKM B-3413]